MPAVCGIYIGVWMAAEVAFHRSFKAAPVRRNQERSVLGKSLRNGWLNSSSV
jgi:hypothetical protein